jgi:hypothetical protein
MHQYQRLMRRRGATTHTDDERMQLLALLQGAPGVDNVEIVGVHPKGGYRTTFDLSADSIDSFLALLDANDWMSVF